MSEEAKAIHISAMGGEFTMCGKLFAPAVKRVRRDTDATCVACLRVAAMGEAAARDDALARPNATKQEETL